MGQFWCIVNSDDTYRFHAMVKPSGAQCNLDCSYCFTSIKKNCYISPRVPRMSEAVLEAHISQYIEAQTGDSVVFSWQGGEPTLMGFDFFHRVVDLQTKYKESWSENRKRSSDQRHPSR